MTVRLAGRQTANQGERRSGSVAVSSFLDRHAIALRWAIETGLLDPVAGPNSLLCFTHSYGQVPVSRGSKGSYKGDGNGTESSNPSSSATQSGLQRNRAALLARIVENHRNSAGLAFKPHRRECPVEPRAASFVALFSGGHTHSPVSATPIRRMQCDHKPMVRRKSLTS